MININIYQNQTDEHIFGLVIDKVARLERLDQLRVLDYLILLGSRNFNWRTAKDVYEKAGKIQAIKFIRTELGLGLKESKDLIENKAEAGEWVKTTPKYMKDFEKRATDLSMQRKQEEEDESEEYGAAVDDREDSTY